MKFKSDISVSPELLGDISRKMEDQISHSLAQHLAEAVTAELEGHQREPRPEYDWKADMRLTGSNSRLTCPGCSRPGLWVQEGPGDYDDGPVHWCREDQGGCGATWSIK